jgi:pyridoxal phosphate enzyme (YggS family)
MSGNIAQIKDTIGDRSIALVAVSKGVDTSIMEEAIACGINHFGENRVQDALPKLNELNAKYGSKLSWHFLGHLQTNKVNKVVGNFQLIHSVDSLRLAEEISEQAIKKGIVQRILLQVKVAFDPNKSGFSEKELYNVMPELQKLSGIKIEGLMTIAPLMSPHDSITSATTSKMCFDKLRNLKDDLEKKFDLSLKELSMGMSDDWTIAINSGSTILRIGRAIFLA